MNPARRTTRSFTYVAFGVLAAILFVVLVAMGLARSFAESRTESVAREKLQQASVLAAVAVSENVARVSTGVGVFARSPFLQDALRAGAPESELAPFAERLHRSIESARVAFIVAPDATVLAMAPVDRSVIGEQFRGRDWYRGVQDESPYLSEAYDIAAFDQPRAVTIAHEVTGTDGKVLGIITAVVLTKFFERPLERATERPEAPRLQVLDQAGEVVAGTAASGGDALVERTPIRDTGWTLVASLDRDVAYADVRSVESAAVAFVAVVSSLLLALGAILALGQRRLDRARRRADRQEQAFELNDTIVQRLAVAHMALSIGRSEEALAQVDSALDAGRRIIGTLADGRTDYVRVDAVEDGDAERNGRGAAG